MQFPTLHHLTKVHCLACPFFIIQEHFFSKRSIARKERWTLKTKALFKPKASMDPKEGWSLQRKAFLFLFKKKASMDPKEGWILQRKASSVFFF